MESSLKTNLFWDYINRFGNTVVSLITSIILARLLSPADYGLVGVFITLGFLNGIVQSKSIDNKMLPKANNYA